MSTHAFLMFILRLVCPQVRMNSDKFTLSCSTLGDGDMRQILEMSLAKTR